MAAQVSLSTVYRPTFFVFFYPSDRTTPSTISYLNKKATKSFWHSENIKKRNRKVFGSSNKNK